MEELVKNVRERFNNNQIRERIFALFCLTVIAIIAMYKLTDPENIVINIVVGITSFAGGVATGMAVNKRSTDPEKIV